MSGAEPRRFLIATAVSHYTHAPEWDRPGLVEARRNVVELFTRQLGYQHVSDLGANPTQQQLLWELREFCRAPDRRHDDIVAVYIAGHGEVVDNDYVLLTSDTDPGDLHDALQPNVLARKILAGTKVRKLLLMLDTCYSGQGGNELLSTMARLKNEWREGNGGLAVITSAQPLQLAQTGAFPELLAEAVTSLATAGYTPENLALDAVVNAARNNPKRPDHQHFGLEIIGLTGKVPPFLPNAKHSPQLSHTDLALQQAAEWDQQDQRRDVEFRTRLLRRAMGHREEDRVGWWFSGRHQALEDITGWLGDLPDDRRSLVVTGAPGSGKTAVLGLLAAVSDPEYRRTVPLSSLGLSRRQMPHKRAIRSSIYAQSLTDEQVVRALAAALRLPVAESVAHLLNHLNQGPAPSRPHVVLIDGLDEAATPTTLCSQVLRPLAELAPQHLRLLLGTRPHLFTPLGLRRADHIDLDAPRYADPRAVLAYTVRNLLDAHPESPYLTCPNDVRLRVAHAVASAAGHSFLVARITAGTLAATPTLPDPQDADWLRSLPSAAADAMHRDLDQRFGADAHRTLDLLRPLAYAQGQGLPWEDIWAPLASEISARRYTNHDLHRLRREAGAYVVEAVEDGRSVYRLYHEAMAEFLRREQDAEAVHQAFTRTLLRTVPYDLAGSRDWGRAHPYALRHLALHATRAGQLDVLMADLEYLVHAESDALTLRLLQCRDDTARLHAAIYRTSIDVHRRLDPPGRRQVLALDAARFNVPEILEALNSKAAKGAWKPVAASGSRVSGNLRHTFTGHTGNVEAVACAVMDGRAIAVSGAKDATVRMWNLATGHRSEPLTGHTGSVKSVVCAELDGRPVAVSGSADSTARVWDLATGRPVGALLTGHTAAVNSVACAEVNGRTVVVTGSDDKTLRVWDLATGRPTGLPMTAGGAVTTVACGTAGEHAVAVSAARSGLEVWDLATLRQRGQLERTAQKQILAVACTKLDGRPVAVGSCTRGRLHLWDLDTLRHLAEWEGHGHYWTPSLVCTELDGQPVAITGSHDGALAVWDLRDRRLVGEPLTGHSSGVLSVAHTSLAGRTIVVSGSFDHTVRVWDLSSRQVFGQPLIGHTKPVSDVDFAVINRRPAIVTAAADDTVRVWDLATAQPLGTPLQGGSDIRAMSCAVFESQHVAVSVARSGEVRSWELGTGRPMGPPMRRPEVARPRMACAVMGQRLVCAASTPRDSVQVWDITTGVDLYPPLTGHRKSVTAVVCTVLEDRPVVVTASKDETLRIWTLDGGRPVRRIPLDLSPSAMACTVVDGRQVAVIGSRDGQIRMWDLATGQPLKKTMKGHTSYVLSVRCDVLEGRPVAVTSSLDNTIRIWDLLRRTVADVLHVPGTSAALISSDTGLLACTFGDDVAVFRRA
ncbi:AAA family ATPase [Streptomyces luteogriseus]|uniref:AAA family ATPase n=1 Tax=Streptomyces luteogriseus TaxID=68233 RepID=UPI00378EA147